MTGGGPGSAATCNLGGNAPQFISMDGKTFAVAQHITVTLTEPGAVSLKCRQESGTGVMSAAQYWMTAIKVGSIN